MQHKNNIQVNTPRVMFAATRSVSGKTTVTCGVLAALKKQNIKVQAYKCGPDYIDPMFHRTVLGIDTGNLDTFFADAGARHEGCRIDRDGRRHGILRRCWWNNDDGKLL